MKPVIYTNIFKTPYGEILLGSFDHQLCIADWRYRKIRTTIDKRIQLGLNATYVNDSSLIIKETKQQLNRYFNKEITSFNIPILMVGTNFQKSVWEALIKISYGTTATYLGLSKKLNSEKAVRAVASAKGANAISIIVPCHRIIGSNGNLIGYAGGLETKKKLLSLENPIFNQQMKLF